jgi:hypothetical protein
LTLDFTLIKHHFMVNKAPQLSSEARERLTFKKIDEIYRTFRTAIRGAVGAFGAYCVLKAIESLAGANTSVSVVVSLILNAFFELKFVLAITLAGSCAAWAIAERKLRHRKVASLSGRLKKLETELDSGRTSSELTAQGKTNPSDKGR